MLRYLLVSLLLSGCGHFAPKLSPRVDVGTIPNDCANQNGIVQWLERQQSGESDEYVRQIKFRIWHLRYTCNPV